MQKYEVWSEEPQAVAKKPAIFQQNLKHLYRNRRNSNC